MNVTAVSRAPPAVSSSASVGTGTASHRALTAARASVVSASVPPVSAWRVSIVGSFAPAAVTLLASVFAVPGSEHEIACETVVFAIGTNANPILGRTSRVALDERGYIRVDEDLATSLEGVFAGGDIVTGAATVIEAMGAGRRAARAMTRYLGLDLGSDVPASPDAAGVLFGIAAEQRDVARVRVA